MVNENVKSFLSEEYGKVSHLPSRERNKELIDKVKERFNVVITGDDVYEICVRTSRLRDKIKEMNESEKKEKPYEVIEGYYVMVKGQKRYKLPVEMVDRMFKDYSEYGNNKSEEQMIQDYELLPEVWNMIKSRLRLYKKSHVFSPYTAENSDESTLDKIIEDATYEHIDHVKAKMVKSHERIFKEEAKKAMRILANRDEYLEHVQKFIERWGPKRPDFERDQPVGNGQVAVVALTDFHIGNGNTDGIKRRFKQAFDTIMAMPQSEINIYSLGDLGESFVPGGMHPGMEETMDLHGIDLWLEIAEIFQEWLYALWKSGKNVTFYGKTGNHDRLGKTHSEDIKRTAGLVIYHLIKRGLSQTEVDVQICMDKISVHDIDGIRYVTHHGDDNFDKRKPEDVLWKNGNPATYNVIMHGDKHSAKLQETKNGMMVQVPCMAGKGEYDTRLDLHSEPGMVIFNRNEYGTVDYTLKRLK